MDLQALISEEYTPTEAGYYATPVGSCYLWSCCDALLSFSSDYMHDIDIEYTGE